jgi:ribosomal protein L12E/L44/L45/RPP1/RPP2
LALSNAARVMKTSPRTSASPLYDSRESGMALEEEEEEEEEESEDDGGDDDDDGDDDEGDDDEGERARSRAAVTSSPTLPSPRVAARTSFPFLYSRRSARPSILGSTTQKEEEAEEEEEEEEALDDDRCLPPLTSSSSSSLALASFSSAFLPQASRSSLLLTESRDSIGLGWRTLATSEEGEREEASGTGKPTARSAGRGPSVPFPFFFFFPPAGPPSSPLEEPRSLALRESYASSEIRGAPSA